MSGETLDMRELRPCEFCGGPIAPEFVVARLERYRIDERAVRQFGGLVDILGGAANPGALRVAEVMAPSTAFAKRQGVPTTVHICLGCARDRGLLKEDERPSRHERERRGTTTDGGMDL